MILRHLVLAAFTLPLLVACAPDEAVDEDPVHGVDEEEEEGVTPPPPEGPVFVGGDRPTQVFAPDNYDHGTPTPLLVVLHGYGATGTLMNAFLGLETAANDRGFLYVVPDGNEDASSRQFWNASAACCDFQGTGVDDAAYLRAIIDEASAIYTVDEKRVFILGHSNGGFMAYRMACDHADAVAAIVSIAGAMPSGAETCAPSQPLAAAQIHGTADETVLYEGGAFMAAYPSAVETVASFAAAVGCAGGSEPVDEARDLEASIEGAETSVARHTACADGGAAELWTVAGGAHVPTPTADFLPSTLDFMFAHPKP